MMTLYYFAHTVAGIVLGLVILITCLRKLIDRCRWPAAFAQSHGATSSAIKAVVRAFPYERNLVEELGNEHLPLSRRNCIRSAPARIVHTLSIRPCEAELLQVPSPSTEASAL
jgi:hypothetical protein